MLPQNQSSVPPTLVDPTVKSNGQMQANQPDNNNQDSGHGSSPKKANKIMKKNADSAMTISQSNTLSIIVPHLHQKRVNKYEQRGKESGQRNATNSNNEYVFKHR
jgi:hypothetical protein